MSQKMRVADYIAQKIAQAGIDQVFMVTGGGAMHLNDAFGRYKNLKVLCCHHEQACSMAAEGYFRMSGKVACVNVTTGPGGTNAITGVWGAWVDSCAMVVVSGQVKYETVMRSTPVPLRQLGDQEVDIIRMVEGITKYAVMVTDPQSIRFHLEKALYLVNSGRPGPVWLDVPINVQGALIEVDTLKGFNPVSELSSLQSEQPLTGGPLSIAVKRVLEKISKAKRPVLMVGSGVRLSQMHESFIELVEALKIPVVTAWNAHDAIWNQNPYYIGRPGTIGDRAGNYAVQNSDLLLVLGCRLNVRQVSYNWDSFANHAHKIMVDVDSGELKKPTLKIDDPIHADLKLFIPELLKQAQALAAPANRTDLGDWLNWNRERTVKYPTVLPEYYTKPAPVNPYCFVEALFKELPEGAKVVTGDGTACVVTFQAAHLKKGQRLFTNSGCASMGFDLPASIGAAIALKGERIVCLAGDGSIQMNLQELQTIVTHQLNIKIFVLNNQGYHSIRQTQRSYFPDNVVGCGTESGLGFPDFEKLAWAYGIPYRKCESHAELSVKINDALVGIGPQICEIVLDLDQQFAPKLASRKLDDGRMVSSPLEDLAPFLSREEHLSNMIATKENVK